MDPIYGQNPDKPIQTPSVVGDSNDPAFGMMSDHPLRPIVTKWLEKIKKAWDFKKEQFGKDARDCMRFFNGPYSFLYSKEYLKESPDFTMRDTESEDSLPAPTFQMTLNKVAEAVQLFGPTLYHKNPYRQVSARKMPELPFGLAQMMAQQQAPPGPAQPPQPGGDGAQLMPPNPMVQMMAQTEQMLQASDQLQTAQDIARAGLMEWYLNYTPRELDLKTEMRAAVDEAMI